MICIYACHLNFKLLQINKNRILSLFRREEMFVRILTEWIVTSSGSCCGVDLLTVIMYCLATGKVFSRPAGVLFRLTGILCRLTGMARMFHDT